MSIGMNKLKVDEALKRLRDDYANARTEVASIVEKYDKLCNSPFPIVFSGLSTRLVINNLVDYDAAEAFLADLYGEWHGKPSTVFFSCGKAIHTWYDPDTPWEIWLEADVNDFPDSLLPKGKGWITHKRTEHQLVGVE